uniref:Methyl-accepting chemotaxis protein n=1 Tax=Paenibacillus sp. Dex50-2 TaxID=247649 RepID=Q6VUH1_9BACL|nr:methyl-accepting chemotaxis protein [Paenibacillus sp. Dex50-2]
MSQYEMLTMQVLLDKDVQSALNMETVKTGKTDQINKTNNKLKELKGPYKDLIGIYMIADDLERQRKLPLFYNISDDVRERLIGQVGTAGGTVYLGLENSIASDEFLNKQKVFAFGRPLKRLSDNKTVGFLLLEVKADAIKQTLADLRLDDEGNSYIASADGKVLVAEEESLLGTKLSFGLKENEQENSWQEVINGNKFIVTRAASAIAGWQVVSVYPVDKLLEDMRQIRSEVIFIALVCSAIIIVLAYFSARRFTHPIEKLRMMMSHGEAGDLTVRADLAGKDELAALGGSFNQMIGKIRKQFIQTFEAADEVLGTSTHLSESSGKMSKYAKEIANATESIAKGAEQQATALEKGNGLVLEMTSNVKQMTEDVQDLIEVSNQAQERSVQGTQHMTLMIGKNRDTAQIMKEISSHVSKLFDRLGEIDSILELIRNISKQTNILSLNATIEANRAGNAGKGFMVIASEVRALAMQSGDSVTRIVQTLDNIRKDMDATKVALLKSGPIMEEQIHSVEQANLIFNQVQEGMDEANKRLSTFTMTMERMDQSQQQIMEFISDAAAVAEQSMAMSQQVASSAADQQQLTEQFVRWSVQLEQVSERLRVSLNHFKTS